MTTPQQTTVALADLIAKITPLPYRLLTPGLAVRYWPSERPRNWGIIADAPGPAVSSIAFGLDQETAAYLCHAASQLPRLVEALDQAITGLRLEGWEREADKLEDVLAAAKAVPVP